MAAHMLKEEWRKHRVPHPTTQLVKLSMSFHTTLSFPLPSSFVFLLLFFFLLHQRTHDNVSLDDLQVLICLPNANKNNWLP